MLGREVELNSVPFYWTVLLGRTIRYTGTAFYLHARRALRIVKYEYLFVIMSLSSLCTGYGEGYTELVLKGKFENMKFLALYLK